MIVVSLALAALLAGAAPAQEDLDQAIKDLAGKISKEGISGKLAEAAATDWGVQAIHEKIDFLLGARTGRFERDPLGSYEDALFTVDANGDLALRPERKEEIAGLAARMKNAASSMGDFRRRCDALVKRLGEDGEFDRRARAAWSDPGFRLAFFHRHPAELREHSTAEIADLFVLRGLTRGADGKLRIGGLFADELRGRIESTVGMLDMIKTYEKSYLQEAAKVKDEAARALLTSDAGIHVILGRLLRQAIEGGAESIGGITEGDEGAGRPPLVSFNLGLDELVPVVKSVQATAAALQDPLDRAAGEIAADAEPEQNLLRFLKSAGARLLLAERAAGMIKDQAVHADEIFAAILEDGFEEKDGRLHVKKGRYVNDQKEESIEALDAELNNVVEEFNGSIRQDFDRLAERCLDSGVIAVLENREATFLLLEHRDLVLTSAVEAVRKQALDVFMKAYLVKQGEVYVVRPDRAARVQSILDRAAAIKKASEK